MPAALTQVEPNIYKYKTQRGQRYCVRLRVKGQDFRERGLRSLDEARGFLKLLCAHTHNGHPLAITVKTYGDEWLAHHLPHVKRNTQRSYRQNWKDYIEPSLGHLPLTDLTRGILKDWMKGLRQKGLSPNSTRLALAPLSCMLNQAVDEGVISENPARRPSKLANVRTPLKKPTAFTAEETEAILKTASITYPLWSAMFVVLFRTGLRVGEALGLDWSDIDWDAHTLHITKSWTNGHLELSPKSGQVRHVPMSTSVERALRQHQEAQTPRSPYVFASTEGTRGHYWNWKDRVWYPCLEKAKARKFSPHHARHTFVTRMLENGESLARIQQICGHSSIQVTVDRYGHLEGANALEAVNKLG